MLVNSLQAFIMKLKNLLILLDLRLFYCYKDCYTNVYKEKNPLLETCIRLLYW